MESAPPPGFSSTGRAGKPQSRSKRRRRSPSANLVSFEADPDLLSFEHLLLAIEIVPAALFKRDSKPLLVAELAATLNRAQQHPVSFVPHVDAVFDIQTELLAAVLDRTGDLAGQPPQGRSGARR